jgi:XTP/dITP diphosphohydrolase
LDADRGAAFVCTLALADPTGAVRLESAGACRGRMIRGARGADEFGYDPCS